MDNHLNIVSFDNPYPPIYGGIIDVFYKIVALQNAGIKIHLHVFSNIGNIGAELNNLCEEVIIYKRDKSFKNQFSITPFIVKTRICNELLSNLQKNNFPILFEGIHTTGVLLLNKELFNRSMIRHHNIEHHYYRGLFKAEKNLIKKLYFLTESIKLNKYIKKLQEASCNFAISNSDAKHLKGMGFKNILTIPPFHSNYSHSSSSEITPNLPFVLYHGNLNVPENNIAVRFLLQHIFTNKNIKYVIAGSCNNIKLREKILQHPNIKLIPNPDSQQIEELLRSANVIVLPTFQNTGIKLKLIESLYKGNHIITNEQMVDGFPLPQLVKIAKSNDQFHRLIREALSHPLEDEKRAERVKMLDIFFSNEDNAQKMIEAFYNLSR